MIQSEILESSMKLAGQNAVKNKLNNTLAIGSVRTAESEPPKVHEGFFKNIGNATD